MLRLRIPVMAVLACALAACPSNVADPEGGAESPLSGRFEGDFIAAHDTLTLDGRLTLQLTESTTGELNGTFALEALLDFGEFQQPIAGGGPLTGSVTATALALLSFTATPDFCPQHTVDFAGSYDRRAGGLLIGGEIDILDGTCVVLYSVPSTIPMRR
jgi:hypothetical protein